MSEKRTPENQEHERLSARSKVIDLLGAITHKDFEEVELTVAPLQVLGRGRFPLLRNRLGANPTALKNPRLIRDAVVNRRDPDTLWGRDVSVRTNIVIGEPMLALFLGHEGPDMLYLTEQKSIAVAVPPFMGVADANPVRLARPNARYQLQIDQWERDAEGYILPIVRVDPSRSTLNAVATLEGAVDMAQRLETMVARYGIAGAQSAPEN